jgi:hypothetical protein
VFFATNDAAKGWVDLCGQASGNAYEAWARLRTEPAPRVWTARQHPLKGGFATATHRGAALPQWQYEVTAGGRVWYLVDSRLRRVYLTYAGTRHPKATE